MNPKACLLFEAAAEGKGQLVMTIHKSDGTLLGEGPGVWMELLDVRKMYQRQDVATANKWPQIPFTPDPLEDRENAILFVHGWNMSPAGAESFSKTFYKRLWQRGFKGRFIAFHWDTHWYDGFASVPLIGPALNAYLAKYNDSEHTAWPTASSLKDFVGDLKFNNIHINVHIAAHSMGNIVASEALGQGMEVANYALMQAAVPAACYDDDEQRIKQAPAPAPRVPGVMFWDSASPDADTDQPTRDLAYRGCFQTINTQANLIINGCESACIFY